ncbi:amino acid adenylation domain-containing protein [Paenibacillus sp. MER TA 81-3]|uniref:non-ribosomal peptide synthetase n=1 Tax=Paenibacillus sp. MER TA 81-3 TaxID=2939573 RepID=UPI00203ED056|nr:non-ribosomal peptide synthetase [Paenibacillus sp. MER TA 81-3]MCM3340537.1 amino acid adenylation domain-containing protein [Paenibacillus sp. MER TA 81-3]
MKEEFNKQFPLTRAQQRIWYIDKLYPRTSVCTLSRTVTFFSSINPDILKQSVQAVIKQHDALRIRVITDQGEVKQYVKSHSVEETQYVDFSKTGGRAYADQWLKTYNRVPLELYDSVLCEFVIFKVSNNEYGYNIKVHRIISDEIGLANLANEIAQHYTDMKNGRLSASHQKPSYLDYIFNEQEYEKSDSFQKDKTYWLEQFDTLPELTELKPHNPLITSTAGERKNAVVPQDLYRKINVFCQENRISIFTFFLGALYVYLHKVTHAKDMVIGINYGNRTTKQEKEMVGMFDNTLPLRVPIYSHENLILFLQRLSQEQSKLLDHRKYPFNQLIEDIRQLHPAKVGELFGIVMEYSQLSLMDLEGNPLQTQTNFCGHEVNDILFHVLENKTENCLQIHIDYRTSLYTDDEISKMIAHFMTTAEYIVKHPSRSIANHRLFERSKELESLSYAVIPEAGDRSTFPATPAQKRLYTLSRLPGGEQSYNIHNNMMIEGPLDRVRFETALESLIARHHTLRTSLELVNGELVQRIHESVRLEVEYVSQTQVVPTVTDDFFRAFNLSQAPLFRVRLVELGEDRHQFLFDIHRIIADEISLDILVREFVRLYEGEELLPLRVQYKDYAIWQKENLQSERLRKQESYWLEVFRGELPLLDLPLDHPHSVDRSFEGDVHVFSIDPLRSQGLRDIAAKTGATLYMVLLAAYKNMLHRYTGQEDIIVGSPIAGRQHPDMTHIIGVFANTLAIRTYPAANKPFLEYVQEVKTATLSAHENQEYPLEELIEKTKAMNAQSRNRLFDTMLVWQDTVQAELNIPDLRFSLCPRKHTGAEFDLTLMAAEIEGSIRCSFEYASSFFRKDTIERMAEHFLQLVNSVAQEPDITLGAVNLLTPREEIQILESFNDTTADYPDEQAIHHLFEEQAARMPEQTAIRYEGARWSYRQLNERANRLARTLLSEGVKANQMVAIIAHRSPDTIAGILAILKIGGAFVPIDPDYPEERIRFILADADVSVLLANSGFKVQNDYTGILIHLNDPKAYHMDNSNLEVLSTSRNLAYVMYTSGTSGRPKGVMVEHRSVVRLVKNTNYVKLDNSTCMLQTGAMVFDASTFEIWGALLNGGQLVLMSRDVLLDTVKLRQIIRTCHINTMFLTTSLFSQLSQQDSLLFAGMDTLIIGGDVLPFQHINRVLRHNPKLRVINGYGPTENTTFSTTYPVEGQQTQALPIGRPICNSTAYVVNRSMKLQPVGIWGELLVGGDGVARGYLNRPELTKERFVKSPFKAAERCYRTGDVARWRGDGTLEFKGRLDEQVKIRGFRIEPGEIEAQLLQVKGVQEAFVMAMEDEGGQRLLCAYIVPNEPLSIIQIKTALSRLLPEYMIPALMVQLDRLPLNTNGKVDLKALPAPDVTLQISTEYGAPQTPTEEKLVPIWQDVLGVSQIGIFDDFFELGGHSIKAMSLMFKLEMAGYYVTLTDIYHYKNIQALSAYIQAGEAENHHDLIHTKEELVAWLYHETREVYDWASYKVHDFQYGIKEIHVLYGLECNPEKVEALLQIMKGKVAKEVAPHYIVPQCRKIESDASGIMDEEVLLNDLGLKPMKDEETMLIRQQLRHDYELNDQWVQMGQMIQKYPLSAIQQMQISFDTPPSVGYFILDEYADYDLLDQAYAKFVQSQGLLRSVPVQTRQWTEWKEYFCDSHNRPKLTMIDLSNCSPYGPFMEMIEEFIQGPRYSGEHIMYQVILIRRNLREHSVLMKFHHILCDRVTIEAAERQFSSYYRSLLHSKSEPGEVAQTYASYIQQISKGPSAITERELVLAYELEDYYQSKKDILNRLKQRRSNESYMFEVDIPTKEHSLDFALSVYTKGLQSYLGLDSLPLLFLYDGRTYEANTYFNVVGEFIDFIPLFINATLPKDEMLRSVNRKLDTVKRHNINFMHLLLHPSCSSGWARTRELVYFGEEYKQLDMFMFNYLGNNSRTGRGYNDTVIKELNLLPIYTLFNCIAQSYKGGFIFSIRCSYDIEVEKVREAFREAAYAAILDKGR